MTVARKSEDIFSYRPIAYSKRRRQRNLRNITCIPEQHIARTPEKCAKPLLQQLTVSSSADWLNGHDDADLGMTGP